ncbi:YihY/virulence factor BrkB family protein [Breoghania sp. L-A4]|nr:YihY/virulence factor BrkB family protein [Breoghania sp. L-A4]
MREQDRGRYADRPSAIPWRGWFDVTWRVYLQLSHDHVMLVAAGATFYFLLALFPGLAAFVALYGIVADPATVIQHIDLFSGFAPTGGIDLIRDQLTSLARQSDNTLSYAFLTGLAVSIWSVNNAIKALFEAMNIAFNEREKRSFLVVNLLSLCFSFAAMGLGILLIFSVGIVPPVLALISLEGTAPYLLALLRWPVVLGLVGIGIILLYRYGPSREPAKWRWLTWGAGFATLIWLAMSIGFSLYIENFANYNATYGTFGAVIGLMVWVWLSVIILIVGAEIDAEIEHQTAIDSTVGDPKPMGQRGAMVADTVGASFNRHD